MLYSPRTEPSFHPKAYITAAAIDNYAWFRPLGRNNIYVAIKILVSVISGSINESQILRHLIHVAPEGAKYVTQLIHEFEHHGPNGVHKFQTCKRGMKIRYLFWIAKRILKLSLQALAFLHENGIAHGDFQPGHILFGLSNIDSKPEDKLRQKEDVQAGLISSPVHFFKEPPTKPVTPVRLRLPEFILTGEVNKTFDIWSVGCLVFELVTGQPLFAIPWYESESMRDDDHLLSFTACLGDLPNNLYKYWRTSSLYFTPERKLYNCQLMFHLTGDNFDRACAKSGEDGRNLK
ncbi:kinase-like domain-containing protein [Ustulina deusta]|nr:kinase-like domain-containing protein [Ustulina deusta]